MKLLYAVTFFLIASFLFLPKTTPAFAQTPPSTGTSNPNFNTLAPCPTCTTPSEPILSGSVTPSVSTPGTNPEISPTPCASDSSVASDNAHHSKHHKHHGAISNFMQQILKFFLKLINMLLQLLGGGQITMPSTDEPALSGVPSIAQSENPSQAMEEPSAAPMVNPCPSQAAEEIPGASTAPESSPALSTIPSGTPNQTLGVCNIPAPSPGPNVVLAPADSTAALSITSGGTATSPKIYDGQCHAVGTITIRADYVVVQNFKVNATGQYGIDSDGTGITIQNNDIKGIHVSGDGDLNAITFFGNDTKIMYNTAIDFVTGDPGQSHTDAIQTWVSSSHPTASANVTIKGNKFTGPANPSRNNSIPSIHQCVMAEGLNQGGNSGGSGNPSNWLISDNYFSDSWGQCIKLDGVDNVSITRNEFAGSSDNVLEVDPASTGVKFYDDNKITGTYGSKPTTVPGPGPTSL